MNKGLDKMSIKTYAIVPALLLGLILIGCGNTTRTLQEEGGEAIEQTGDALKKRVKPLVKILKRTQKPLVKPLAKL